MEKWNHILNVLRPLETETILRDSILFIVGTPSAGLLILCQKILSLILCEEKLINPEAARAIGNGEEDLSDTACIDTVYRSVIGLTTDQEPEISDFIYVGGDVF